MGLWLIPSHPNHSVSCVCLTAPGSLYRESNLLEEIKMLFDLPCISLDCHGKINLSCKVFSRHRMSAFLWRMLVVKWFRGAERCQHSESVHTAVTHPHTGPLRSFMKGLLHLHIVHSLPFYAGMNSMDI